jgi:hypothetical protein
VKKAQDAFGRGGGKSAESRTRSEHLASTTSSRSAFNIGTTTYTQDELDPLYDIRRSTNHIRHNPPSLNSNEPPSTTTTTMLGSIANMQPRQLAAQVLNFALVLSTAFMLWKGLSVATNSSSPIVVVLSGSMEPAFQRGDLLFLWNRGAETQVGEVVVYNVRGKDIPIVHRVIRRFGGG